MLDNAKLPDTICNKFLSLLFARQDNQTQAGNSKSIILGSKLFEDLKNSVPDINKFAQQDSLEDVEKNSGRA